MHKITVSASSQTGMVRDHNEDAVLVSHQVIRDAEVNTSALLGSNDRYVVAVCDGLGGQNAGEIASMDAAEQLEHRFQTLRPGQSIERIHQVLKEWVKEEHCYLLASGQDDPGMEGMGTTLVALFFYEGRVCWMNCGDSRLYRLRRGILRQLSSDHSLINITHKSTDAHVILNCLGGGVEDVYLDFEDMTSEVLQGDVFLLCSDGLTDMLKDEMIEKILNETPSAHALTEAAIQCGGLDNVSACVITVDSIASAN